MNTIQTVATVILGLELEIKKMKNIFDKHNELARKFNELSEQEADAGEELFFQSGMMDRAEYKSRVERWDDLHDLMDAYEQIIEQLVNKMEPQ